MEKPEKKRVLLFYCVESEQLARKIASQSPHIHLQSINWRSFDDGFPNLFINNAQDIRGQHVSFLASFSSPAVIFEQLSVIFALPRLFVASFTLVLPFFPTGSFERMEEEGDVATAFTMARILSNIPISRGGPTSIVIYDIHALQERFYFSDNVLPFFETGIPLLKQRLHQLPDADNIVIAFPDDGAWKRFHKQLDHYPMVVCAKVREGDKRIVRLKEGNPEGCHVVIVDDLVQSGGTLIECQFWQLMVQPKLVRMLLMQCSLKTPGRNLFTKMVKTRIRHLPSFGSLIPAPLRSKALKTKPLLKS
uniref:ribose-phosphate pyrophosphokinase 4 isoform X2 n=1 Tax=Erigeron canadensis TaxID=72917 RepID=UPI001CB8DAC0|nr:ribose-phosphate pyrophosphokinase 4 isoform X2 [Erigeron canadensis]